MNIVVRGTNWIGDSVMTVPALRALRQVFPDSKIFLHTRSWAEGIFRDADFIDGLITYDTPATSLQEVVTQSRTIRAQSFDLAVVFPNSFASALTMRFARVPRRFGYSKEARGLILTDPIDVPPWKAERHEVYYYLWLVEEVERIMLGTSNISFTKPSIDLNVSEYRRREAREFLEKRGFDFSRPVIAIGPGSTNSRAKRWPAERFTRLIDMLGIETRANVMLLGGPDDREVADLIMRAASYKPLDLIGKTSLGDAAAILSVSDLMISNDMGLAHLAPAVGTRTIVIFGPTNEAATRPFSDLAKVIRVDVECSPCMLRDCPIDHRCMTRISADSVFESALTHLNKNDSITTAATSRLHRP